MLKRTAKRGGKKILLGWNRGLGDIALGLYAIVERIRTFIPDAEIVFLTRQGLVDGFSMLSQIRVLVAPNWKRGEGNVTDALREMGIDPKGFDLIIERPNPTDWVSWQRGTVTPRLKWNEAHELLWKKFGLSQDVRYIGAQPIAETNYGLWRNWPLERWNELFDRIETQENTKVLLFGFGDEPKFSQKCVVDLRGKTTLFELLSIAKNCLSAAILPDSGILSMIYYLDASFPIRVLSLWGDPNHGILKQAVASPNPELRHTPLIGALRNLGTVSVSQVMHLLFPARAWLHCPKSSDIEVRKVQNSGCILLAGGEGTRLGAKGPKGLFSIREKTLFQWICEKGKEMPLAVMTSPLNHKETVRYFRKMNYFDREVFFFQQSVLGERGPDGNGSVFKSFVESKIADLFQKRGIDCVSIIPVDNPLADPSDEKLLSFHRSEGSDITIKCIEKKGEGMGALAERDGRLEIVEYIDQERGVPYVYAYTGMMAISLPFFYRMADIELPLHWVLKRNKLKGERFIFDALPYAKKISALCYPREECYAPLKSLNNLEEIERILKINIK
jgi:ADP-heptose:LPS heptosyltransferase/molybdopterin-guanine dinucleotide biosynthesis protein A